MECSSMAGLSIVDQIGTGGELLWTRYWTFGFHKMLGIYQVAAQLVASGVVLSSTELERDT
jgi:hypothetical protein